MEQNDAHSEAKPQEHAAKEGGEELEACRKERGEYLAGWQRAKADFINYKKEEAQRFEEIARYANAAILQELIPVLDSFDLGLRALEKAGPVEKGVYMIRASLEDALRRQGLVRVPLAPGNAFDPSFAEIVGETESEQPPGTVAEEVAPAYRLHGKVIRPAKVRVSKSKAASE